MTITLKPDESAPLELTGMLKDWEDESITETVAYPCQLDGPQFVYPDVSTRIESAVATGTDGL